MIDPAKSPNCATWEKKNAKLLREQPKYREILEAVAAVESQSYDVLARSTIGGNLVKRLRGMMPKDPERDMLTPVDLRTLLTQIKAEVEGAAQSLSEIR